MNFFQVVTDVASTAGHRVSLLAEAVAKATVDVPKAFFVSASDAVNKQAAFALEAIRDGIELIQHGANDGLAKVTTSAGEILSDVQSVILAPLVLANKLIVNSSAIVSDAFHWKIDFNKVGALIADVQSESKNIVDSVTKLVTDTSSASTEIYSQLEKGGALAFGKVDGLLGVNVVGSFLGGNSSDGLISDARGFTGPIPLSVSWDNGGLVLGAETPITGLLQPALLSTPSTAFIAPLIAPLNLGGLGVSGKITFNGFEFKSFAVTGPSFETFSNVSANATAEVGSYNKVDFLKWHTATVGDIPLVGDVLKYIPVVKDIPVTYPTVELNIDSKLYAQIAGGINIFGKGPNGQIEVIHDVDNDISIISKIVADTLSAAWNSGNNIIAAIVSPIATKADNVEGSLSAPQQSQSDIMGDHNVQLVGLAQHSQPGDMLAA